MTESPTATKSLTASVQVGSMAESPTATKSPTAHNYKVYVSVESKNTIIDRVFFMLKFHCNIRFKYVIDRAHSSNPIIIIDRDTWDYFHLPIDALACGDNYSSEQPQRYIIKMVDRLKIPFKLDRLFLKKSARDIESVPLLNLSSSLTDVIVRLIFDAAIKITETISSSQCKAQFLLVTIEKEITVPEEEYTKMLKAKGREEEYVGILKAKQRNALKGRGQSL